MHMLKVTRVYNVQTSYILIPKNFVSLRVLFLVTENLQKYIVINWKLRQESIFLSLKVKGENYFCEKWQEPLSFLLPLLCET